MKKQSKETLEERIEKSGELFKQQMRDKVKEMLDLNDNDLLTIDQIEEFWRASRQYSDKLILDFYNDTANKEIQKAQVSKKN
ncbi:MAG: hypothetical protein Ta2B_09190 [Termitinemataceae bacterium]|nr:MAG: hypothetical protein Ta2B_09190 [Termitinemataceae bacterium]